MRPPQRLSCQRTRTATTCCWSWPAAPWPGAATSRRSSAWPSLRRRSAGRWPRVARRPPCGPMRRTGPTSPPGVAPSPSTPCPLLPPLSVLATRKASGAQRSVGGARSVLVVHQLGGHPLAGAANRACQGWSHLRLELGVEPPLGASRARGHPATRCGRAGEAADRGVGGDLAGHAPAVSDVTAASVGAGQV